MCPKEEVFANKNLVLVTSEAGLMPLAGSVGLYVADSPNSKPVIPPAPAGPSDEPEDIDEPLNITDGSSDTPEEDFDTDTAGEMPVGGRADRVVRRGDRAPPVHAVSGRAARWRARG